MVLSCGAPGYGIDFRRLLTTLQQKVDDAWSAPSKVLLADALADLRRPGDLPPPRALNVFVIDGAGARHVVTVSFTETAPHFYIDLGV